MKLHMVCFGLASDIDYIQWKIITDKTSLHRNWAQRTDTLPIAFTQTDYMVNISVFGPGSGDAAIGAIVTEKSTTALTIELYNFRDYDNDTCMPNYIAIGH